MGHFHFTLKTGHDKKYKPINSHRLSQHNLKLDKNAENDINGTSVTEANKNTTTIDK
jgi:hypothetical protein